MTWRTCSRVWPGTASKHAARKASRDPSEKSAPNSMVRKGFMGVLLAKRAGASHCQPAADLTPTVPATGGGHRPPPPGHPGGPSTLGDDPRAALSTAIAGRTGSSTPRSPVHRADPGIKKPRRCEWHRGAALAGRVIAHHDRSPIEGYRAGEDMSRGSLTSTNYN